MGRNEGVIVPAYGNDSVFYDKSSASVPQG